jgi:hypothetical protein
MLFDLISPGGDYRRFGEPDLSEETLVSDAIEWFSKTVSGHVDGAYVLHVEFAEFDTLFGVVVSNIDVLSTLIVTVSLQQFKGWLIVTVQEYGISIGSGIAELVEQAGKPGGFFGCCGHRDVLCLCGGDSNKTLLS